MVLDKIKEKIAEKLCCSADEIKADSKFDDLGLDSLDKAEMLMSLEDDFGINIEMNDSIATVGDLAQKIEAAKS